MAAASSILMLSGMLGTGESCRSEDVVAHVELWISNMKGGVNIFILKSNFLKKLRMCSLH